MTILPGFYEDSVFQYPFNFQLISVANSLKQQNRFDESEEIIERLIKTATGTVEVLAEQTFPEPSATEELKQKDQLEEVWWSTSQLRGYVRESYKQYNCVLTVASSGLRGLEYVQLLAGSRTWSLECLYEAVLAALDTGSLETLECLIQEHGHGHKNCVRVVLAGEKHTSVVPFKREHIEMAIKAAKEGLRDSQMERARETFQYDRDGVLELLMEAKKKL
ncbi:hypothetical protein BKA60DRAFT_658758 [Fusarium oxysporum]|nr:hypothetical protein BKA60DRAFT_658758 [Fusarium oxysporum]